MSIPYRPEIDGLRALAVLPVVIFHMALDWQGERVLAGGYIGVDIFFTISGYLICSLLLVELENDRFSLAGFYERRARRILPALFFVMLACLPFAWWLMDQVQLEQFGESMGAVSLFVANLLFWSRSGYFGEDAELNPLLHTWSLAVEEQFYLVFPLLLWLLWIRQRQRIGVILSVILLASLAMAVWQVRVSADAAFYLAHTRAWELLAGALVAYWHHRQGRPPATRLNNVLPVAGVLIILVSIFTLDEQSRVPGEAALLPVAGTALILGFGGADPASRLLRWRPLVAIGLVSYSLYLWHQPVFVFARMYWLDKPQYWHYLLLFLLSLVLAALSYRWIEQPVRRRNGIGARALWLAACLVIMLTLACAWLLVGNKGFPGRLPAGVAELGQYGKYDFKPLLRDRQCLLHPDQQYADLSPTCFSPQPRPVVIWGDSHAAALYPGFRHVFNGERVTQITTASCPPVLGLEMKWIPHCQSINEAALEYLAGQEGADVYLLAYWPVYQALGDRGLAHNSSQYLSLFEDTLSTLSTSGIRVTVLGGLPVWYPSLPARVGKYLRVNGALPEKLPLSQDLDLLDMDARLKEMAGRHGHRFVSIIGPLCPDGLCSVRAPGVGAGLNLLQWDASHPTQEGAQFIASKILPAPSSMESD